MKLTSILATMLLMLFAFACAEPEATDADAATDQTEMTTETDAEMADADEMMEADSMDADDMMESEMHAADMDDASAHEDQMEEHAEEPSNID